ncbi:MAG TPA: glycosyltransferase family 2 protein [Egicoccus sp.]|nr:glycosyltransferase family 2 protein [Egicoccus sp.]HSK22903.1 glycosyltransferase family 2 protein [Egicoccus sp.]
MTPQPGRVLALVPAFNEEDMVGVVVRQVLGQVPDVDVLVVDDGSTDATAMVARRAGGQVLTLPYNLGVGGAIRVGYRFAARRGYDAVVQIDADGQHDPADVPRLLAALADADLVVGARFAGRGDYAVDPVRRLAMRYFARKVSRVAGVPLTDVTSGFRAAGPRTIATFAANYPLDYLSDTVEALLLAVQAGLRVRQVPVAMQQRRGGQPSQSYVRLVASAGRAVLQLQIMRFRANRPGRAAVDASTPARDEPGATTPAGSPP